MQSAVDQRKEEKPMTDIERVARAIERAERDNYPDMAIVAIAAYKAALADAGLVIVPRPATMEMRDAGLKAWRSSRDKHEEQLLMDVHEAMMAAYTEKA